jgi:hypothetical protein
LKIIKFIIILISCSLIIVAPSGALHADSDFTLVIFPDAQKMVKHYPSIWEAMAQWVVDHRVSNNIQAVISSGDMTNGGGSSEYKEALVGWNNIKNAGIPYVPIMGNHDYNDVTHRNVTWWNTYLGSAYFSGKRWYEGNYSSSGENYYIKLDIGTQKYLVLALEFFPRNKVLTWAQRIITANADRQVIIATHGYLNADGTRIQQSDSTGPVYWRLSADNGGQQLWDKLIKLNSNIIMVICGHQHGRTSAYAPDYGVDGNLIHQFFINHQDGANGGNGYLALLKFRPSLGRIEVTTYSPALDAYDPTGAYTMPVTVIKGHK